VEKQGVPAEETPVVEAPRAKGPGERLRAARAAAGLTVEGVADDLHLSPEVLEAMERDDYSHLPGRVFARGYLRNYARLVDLPVDQILAAFDASAPAPGGEGPALQTVVSVRQIRSQARSSHSVVRAVTWVVVLALVALLLTWWQGYLEWPEMIQGSGDARPDAPVILLPPVGEAVPPSIQRDVAPLLQDERPAATAEPAANAPAAPSAPVAGDAAAVLATPAVTSADQAAAPPAEPPTPTIPETAIELSGRSWLEVIDSSGAFKLNGTFEKGYRKTFEGEPPYRIAIGNYTVARVLVGGNPVDLLPHFNGRIVRFTLDPREPVPQ